MGGLGPWVNHRWTMRSGRSSGMRSCRTRWASASPSFGCRIPLDSAGFGFHWMIDEGKVCGWFLLVCCCFRITRYITIYQDEVIQCQIEVVRQFSSRRMAPYALLHCFVETSWRFHKSSGPTAIGWSLWYELNRIKLKWTCALGEHSHSNICNGR